ncbi:hypothetical protein F5B21DRAFT_472161 [Xylaria acuta]|nr:hypothetical protein F5B21DRAFT_472161 [Xylaria acuta]
MLFSVGIEVSTVLVLNLATGKTRKKKKKKNWLLFPVDWEASGIEPDAGVEPATLRLRVSRSTD